MNIKGIALDNELKRRVMESKVQEAEMSVKALMNSILVGNSQIRLNNQEAEAVTDKVMQDWQSVAQQWNKLQQSGQSIEIDRCKPIRLYQTQEISNYRPSRPTPDQETSRQDKIMVNRLMRMANEDECSEKEKMMLKAIAMYISKKHRDWLLPDPEQNWLQISADLIHLRRQNEEDIARKVSGEDTSWLECEDELKQRIVTGKQIGRAHV